ncbi:MAG TPA: HEAT repeat domain-containing protein, partial [Kofleriaceae bacterium]
FPHALRPYVATLRADVASPFVPVPAAIHHEKDDDDDDDDGDDDDDDSDGDDDDDESEGSDDEDRGRHIARQAAELLKSRALAGKLDTRAGDALLSRLRKPEPPRSVVEVIGAARHRNAVPALIAILEQSIDDELVAATARALGAIGDPRAVPALCDVAAAPGTFVAKPAAAAALANCLASARDARTLDDAELFDALAAIIEAGAGRLDPVTCFAVGRIARLLPPHRRAEARRRIQELDPAGPEPEAQLAREIALQLASPAVPPPPPPPEARTHLERALSDLEGASDAMTARWKLALDIAVTVPDIVDMHSILPLTRVLDPEVRAAAHAVLARLGHPAPVAPIFDVAAAHRLDDGELVRRLDTVHTIGRDMLVAELGRRKLPAARPAIVAACHTAIAAASTGERVFEHDRRLLEAAMPILARSPDADVGAVVDRMAQHPNGALQKLAKKWHHLRHDDEEIN